MKTKVIHIFLCFCLFSFSHNSLADGGGCKQKATDQQNQLFPIFAKKVEEVYKKHCGSDLDYQILRQDL